MTKQYIYDLNGVLLRSYTNSAFPDGTDEVYNNEIEQSYIEKDFLKINEYDNAGSVKLINNKIVVSPKIKLTVLQNKLGINQYFNITANLNIPITYRIGTQTYTIPISEPFEPSFNAIGTYEVVAETVDNGTTSIILEVV